MAHQLHYDNVIQKQCLTILRPQFIETRFLMFKFQTLPFMANPIVAQYPCYDYVQGYQDGEWNNSWENRFFKLVEG
jgi:hypothetical protein